MGKTSYLNGLDNSTSRSIKRSVISSSFLSQGSFSMPLHHLYAMSFRSGRSLIVTGLDGSQATSHFATDSNRTSRVYVSYTNADITAVLCTLNYWTIDYIHTSQTLPDVGARSRTEAWCMINDRVRNKYGWAYVVRSHPPDASGIRNPGGSWSNGIEVKLHGTQDLPWKGYPLKIGDMFKLATAILMRD